MTHSAEKQLQLPLPLDAQQLALLASLQSGPAVCSMGTPRYDALMLLVQCGLVIVHHTPRAGNTWQFSLPLATERWLFVACDATGARLPL